MECPYLGGVKRYRICNASVTLMTPGENDVRKYCLSGEYFCCPTMLAHLLRGTASAKTRVNKAAGF